MASLPDGDQRGQRIADNGQLDRAKETVWQTAQFKRQRSNLLPRDQPGQSTLSQNGHRKRVVLALAFANGVESTSFSHMRLDSTNGLGIVLDSTRHMKAGIAQHTG